MVLLQPLSSVHPSNVGLTGQEQCPTPTLSLLPSPDRGTRRWCGGKSVGDSVALLLPYNVQIHLSSWWPSCPHTKHPIHPTVGSIKVGFTAQSPSERSTNLHKSTKTVAVAALSGTAGAAKTTTPTPGQKDWTNDSGKTSLKLLFGNAHPSLSTMRWKPCTVS